MKKIIFFFVYTHIFLALCVTSLVVETYIILFGSVIDLKYPFFLFCSTLTLYSFHRIYRFDFNAPEHELAPRHRWIKANRDLFYSVFLLAAIGVILSVVFFVSLRTILYLLPIGIICFGYTVPVIPWKGKWIRFRDIPGMKIILISIVLGATTVLLPILAYEKFEAAVKPAMIFVFARRLLFIFAITVPFDIRDVDFDRKIGTRTLPVVFGIERSKRTALIALLLFILLAFIQAMIFPGTDLRYGFSIFLSMVISAIVINKTNENRDELFYSIAVEGMMLLQCLLVMTVNRFL